MPSPKRRVKRETSVAKVSRRIFKIPPKAARRQLNVLPVAGQSTMEMLPQSPSSTHVSREGVHITRPAKASLPRTWQHVPVIGIDRKPLMPSTLTTA